MLSGSQKTLGANADAERREVLKQYLLRCFRDNVLSWTDLVGANVLEKLMGAISKDVVAVVKDLGRAGAGGLLRTAGVALAGIAEDVVAGRRSR